jgi:trimethylamine--corrinoid protein Co-methyltransferase
MLKVNFATNRDTEALGEGVFGILEKVGMCFQNAEILFALEESGAQVNHTEQTVIFPRPLLLEFVDNLRKETATRALAEERFHAPALPTVTGSVAQFIYDHDRKQTRPGRRDDLVAAVKLGEALHPAEPVGHALVLTEMPPLIEPLEAALVLAEYASIPAAPFAWDIRQAPYLEKMGNLLGLERWYSLGAVCIAHPLCFDRNTADRYVHMMRHGLRPAGLTSMPVAGVSAPVTVEGFLALTAAEFLAAWIVGRALNPNISLGGSMWAGTSDMQTGHVSYSSFDSMFYAIATMQFLRAWCGVTVSVGGGEYCASRIPGLYAALEKAYKAMTIAAFTGAHPTIGEGMLDSGKAFSAEQLILDREFGLGVQQFAREIAPTDENIALDAIVEIGRGAGGSHLTTDHTALRFRDSLWLPHLLSRKGWTGCEDETTRIERYHEEALMLTQQAHKPEGREDVLEAMRKVVEKAKSDLID